MVDHAKLVALLVYQN